MKEEHDLCHPRTVVVVQVSIQKGRHITGHEDRHPCIRGRLYDAKATNKAIQIFYETKRVICATKLSLYVELISKGNFIIEFIIKNR